MYVECENGKYPKQLKVYKKIKKVKKWTTCRNSCIDDPNCDYFKWKVHRSCLLRILLPIFLLNFVEQQ